MKNHCCHRFRFLMPVFVLGFVALLTWAVQCLWNRVLVDVVSVHLITYWQALGLLALSKILFGGFPGRCGCGPGFRDRMMAKKWASMDPEQRERMREEMRRRFGDWPRWEEPDDRGSGSAKPAADA